MNRVTDFLPAECAINESHEILSYTSDCLEAPLRVIRNRLALPFCLHFREEGLVIDAN